MVVSSSYEFLKQKRRIYTIYASVNSHVLLAHECESIPDLCDGGQVCQPLSPPCMYVALFATDDLFYFPRPLSGRFPSLRFSSLLRRSRAACLYVTFHALYLWFHNFRTNSIRRKGRTLRMRASLPSQRPHPVRRKRRTHTSGGIAPLSSIYTGHTISVLRIEFVFVLLRTAVDEAPRASVS